MNLNRKVLVVYSSLLFVTVVIAFSALVLVFRANDTFTAFVSINRLRATVYQVELLRMEVETYPREVTLADINRRIAEAIEQSSRVCADAAHSPHVCAYSESITEEIISYGRAIGRLQENRIRRNVLIEELLASIEQLNPTQFGLQGTVHSILGGGIGTLEADILTMVLTSDFRGYPEIRRKLESLLLSSTVGEFSALVLSIVDACDALYIADREIAEHRKLLLDTATAVEQNIDTIFDTVQFRETAINRAMKIIEFSLVAIALVVAAFLWIVTARYVQNFLGNYSLAISAINHGRFSFPVLFRYRDELGALTSTLRDVLINLGVQNEKLAASEAWYRTLFNSSTDAFSLVTESDLVIEDVNDRFIELFGVSRDEAIGRSLVSFAGEESDRNILFTEENNGYYWRPYRKDKSRFWAVTHLRRIETNGRKRVLAVTRDITADRESADELRSLARERTTLLRELHHRTKNNLQIILSMISLKRGVSEDAVRADGTEMILVRELESHIHAMAMVHEALFASESLTELDLSVYLQQIISFTGSLSVRYDTRITIIPEMIPVMIPSEIAVSLGIVVNELLTNALKHAFRGKVLGTIRVGLSRANGMIAILISDDGIGCATDILERERRSMGLRIVQSLIQDQLKGEIRLSCDAGTEWHITIPY